MSLAKRLVLGAVSGFLSLPAAAELGGVVDAFGDTVAKDQRVLRATRREARTEPAYTVHVLSAATTEVSEFARADGTVFAVTWRGPKRPDLASLLGAYYQEYAAAEPRRGRGRGPRAAVVKASRVVVSRGGQMRDLHGKAFVPELVPTGVDVGSL